MVRQSKRKPPLVSNEPDLHTVEDIPEKHAIKRKHDSHDSGQAPAGDSNGTTSKRRKHKIESNSGMYKWDIAKTGDRQGSNEAGSLKMTFRKVPKTPPVKNREKTVAKLNALRDAHKAKYSAVVDKKITGPVIVTKAQPFRKKIKKTFYHRG